jgi:hypothetical protein
MKLEILLQTFTVCQILDLSGIDFTREFVFFAKTDDELSLVCETESVPQSALIREDGWRGFRVQGMLAFSETGVLSALSSLLAEHSISIFAVSTFNTDYIFTKSDAFDRAIAALSGVGYAILE